MYLAGGLWSPVGCRVNIMHTNKWGGIMIKISEAKMKEVINIGTGERLGYINDFEIDLDKGIIVAMIMSTNMKGLSFFSKSNDVIITWEEIVKIGQDTILVDFTE